MQKPAEISDANWARLKTFAEPLEDDLDTVLNGLMAAVEAHEDCPGPPAPGAAPSTAHHPDHAATGPRTQDQGGLEHQHSAIPREQTDQDPGDPAQVESPPPRTGPQMADAILRYMHDNGGAVVADDVYRHMTRDMEPPLNPIDMEVMVGGRPRWRKAADRGRQELKARGLIHSDVTPMPWRLTPEGWREAKRRFGPVQDHTDQATPRQTPGAAAPEPPADPTRGPADTALQDPHPAPFPSQAAAPEPAAPPVHEAAATEANHSTQEDATQDTTHIGQEDATQDANHTAQSFFNLPILQILADAGGTAPVNHVIKCMERRMTAFFTTKDMLPTPDHPQRWRATMHNARLNLARRGFIQSHADRGLWQLTQKGQQHLAFLTGSTRDQTPTAATAEHGAYNTRPPGPHPHRTPGA